MPITPEQIFQIYETSLIGICLSAGGLGAAAWLGHMLWKRSQEGPPQTHLIAKGFEQAQQIAAAQSGEINVVEVRRSEPGRPARMYLQPDVDSQPQLSE